MQRRLVGGPGAFGVGWALFQTDSGGLGAGPPTAGGTLKAKPDVF